jgi:hypothetical protein
LQAEALVNKDESQTALRYLAQIVALPLVTGFVLSRALADPVLSFTLQVVLTAELDSAALISSTHCSLLL